VDGRKPREYGDAAEPQEMTATEARYQAMTTEQLTDERDRLLIRLDRWITEGRKAFAAIVVSKLDKVEGILESREMPVVTDAWQSCYSGDLIGG
jgi:hypothetical protein